MLPRSGSSASVKSRYRSRASGAGPRPCGIELTRQTCMRPDQKKVSTSPSRMVCAGLSTLTRLSRTEPCSMNSRATWRLLTSLAHHKYLSKRTPASDILLVHELRTETAKDGKGRIGIYSRCRRSRLPWSAFGGLPVLLGLKGRNRDFLPRLPLVAPLGGLAAG